MTLNSVYCFCSTEAQIKKDFIPAGRPQNSSGRSGKTLWSGPHAGNDTQTQVRLFTHAHMHTQQRVVVMSPIEM